MQKNKQRQPHMIGTLQMAYEGYGFVISDQKGAPDAFIPAHAIGDCLNKDRVEITLEPGRGGKMEGRIVKILERGLKQIVGRFEMRGQGGIVVSEDLRVAKMIVIPKRGEMGARHNEMVVVKIVKYPVGNKPIEGEVIKRIGRRGNDDTELTILAAKHQLPEEFPDSVVSEADRVVDDFTGNKERFEREDLTGRAFITIDGETAKDFDDAVYAERIDSSSTRLWISIADVSNFVREGGQIDLEASKRATSVYLPGTCVPMLPEQLSTNICSLVPDEDRFCFTAEMVVRSDGETVNHRFYRSRIKSKYRMTYTEANAYLSRGEKIPVDGAVLRSLENLKVTADWIRKRRSLSGSIDFDLPEPEINLDLQGKPESIVKAERNSAHMLIEDLMIAANEAVASFLTQRRYPCVYRVHDLPDTNKLMELKVLLKYLGHKVKFGREPTPKTLSHVVNCVHGLPEERLINMLLLRSMAQAVYSTKNIGHFGLASSCYCHFTSPIRRYPDLLVHRLLADALKYEKARRCFEKGYLINEAERSSKMERRSMEAEREAISLYSAIFMRDHVGEVFDGIISHVAKKGIFVELLEYFVEGLLDPTDLIGDTFKFDPKAFSYVGRKTNKGLHIGEKIRVVVKDVSIEDRRIFFEPA